MSRSRSNSEQDKGFVSRVVDAVVRRRIAAIAVLLVAVLAFFAFPYVKGYLGSSADDLAFDDPENNPAATLTAMTDADLKAFAANDRLPAYLASSDWVRSRVIRETLREHLGQELVRRWERDGGPISTATSSNWTHTAAIEAPRPGVLGVLISDHGPGITVTRVYPNSAASRAGIRVGDQILAVNHHQIHTQADLVGQLSTAAYSSGVAQLDVQRNMTRRSIRADVSGRGSGVASRGLRRY